MGETQKLAQFARKVIRAYAWGYDTPDDDHLGLGLEAGDDWYEFTDLASRATPA